jgi:hypothetical protein
MRLYLSVAHSERMVAGIKDERSDFVAPVKHTT